MQEKRWKWWAKFKGLNEADVANAAKEGGSPDHEVLQCDSIEGGHVVRHNRALGTRMHMVAWGSASICTRSLRLHLQGRLDVLIRDDPW